MTDTPAGSSTEFAASFKAFLDQMVAQAPEKPGPFLERLRGLFGTEPLGLPVVAEQFDVPDHPNLQRAIDAYLSGGGLQHAILGVSIDPYGRASLADLLGQRGDQAPQPGPVEYVNVALDRVLPCIQNGPPRHRGQGGPCRLREDRTADFARKVYIEDGGGEGAESFLAELRRRMRERTSTAGGFSRSSSMKCGRYAWASIVWVASSAKRSSCPTECSNASNGRRCGSPRMRNACAPWAGT